jgi:5-methylcytosine-specific restriction endonuclease McrA
MSETIPRQLKKFVIERAHGCCEYCHSQERYAPTVFSIEHIIPRKVGGASTADNLAFSCQECNNHKYTKTEAPDPSSGEIVPLIILASIVGETILPGVMIFFLS